MNANSLDLECIRVHLKAFENVRIIQEALLSFLSKALVL